MILRKIQWIYVGEDRNAFYISITFEKSVWKGGVQQDKRGGWLN